MSDQLTAEVYRCHGLSNDVSTLLLCDPVINRTRETVLQL